MNILFVLIVDFLFASRIQRSFPLETTLSTMLDGTEQELNQRQVRNLVSYLWFLSPHPHSSVLFKQILILFLVLA